MRELTVYVQPEFSSPKRATDANAVAAGGDATSQPDNTWLWDEGGTHTMHMFWAVRRLTPSRLKSENAKLKAGEIPARFNCSLVDRTTSNVCISSNWGKTTNRARTVTIPVLVNHEPLQKDEELIMELPEPVEKEKKLSLIHI